MSILNQAEKEGYGVLAMTCYDAQSAIALVRAAERAHSPAIIQLLPDTVRYGRGPYLQFFLNLAHRASVPISVHLDHGVDPTDLDLVFGLADKGTVFDSIMIDPPRVQNEDENINVARDYTDRAHQVGMAVELELGRVRGHSRGLHETEGQLTDPEFAERYIKETGANILAPNIGNVHGPYDHPIVLRQDVTKKLKETFKGSVPLTLHGATDLPADILKDCVRSGFSKINVNRYTRRIYANTLATEMRDKNLPDAIENATEILAGECDKYFKLFGSAGKA
ncbi:hypothetical protein AX16_009489 [Volvariella volvacea WC 439]|nr:hypothetical protein AX16_009489 [Volvariella volvacea WC 439]